MTRCANSRRMKVEYAAVLPAMTQGRGGEAPAPRPTDELEESRCVACMTGELGAVTARGVDERVAFALLAGRCETRCVECMARSFSH